MKILTVANIFVLFFLLGCVAKDEIMQEDDFLKNFESSLIEQGMEVNMESPTNAVDIDGKVPHEYTLSADDNSSDRVFVFVFDSVKEANQGLEKAKTAVATQTQVDEYKKENVLVFYYALDGDLKKYSEQIKKAMDLE